MTSAARPTFLPAVGGHSLRDTGAAPTHIVRAKEQTAHTKLKDRSDQFHDKSAIDFKRKLESSENENTAKNRSGLLGPGRNEDPGEAAARRKLLEQQNIDADDSDDSEDSNQSSDDSDEDDTAELMRELAKIKRERAEEAERQEREKDENEARMMEDRAKTGNPLMASATMGSSSFTVKRRWDDDVIFKNQGKSINDGNKKQFINDMLRSDFHRKFMNKYVR